MFILNRSTLRTWIYSTAIILTIISYDISPVGAQVVSYDSPYSEAEILQAVNLVRTEAGLKPLVSQVDLQGAAKLKAVYMNMKSYFDHWSPDGSVPPWNFLSLTGYNYQHVGENLALDYSSAEDVIEAMMASPSHRANLLGVQYKDIGIEVSSSLNEGVVSRVVVMFFGTRL